MPKIIDNLPKLIVQKAKNCFEEHGYQSVDMSMIAKEADIAVGTIYNYYSNKAELFLDTVKLSWHELEAKLDELEADNPREKLKKTVKAYYQFGKAKKGLWEDIIQAKMKEDKQSLYSRNVKGLDRVVNLLIKILNSNGCDNVQYSQLKRIGINIMMTVVGFLREIPEEDETNYKFLYDLVDQHLEVLLKNTK